MLLPVEDSSIIRLYMNMDSSSAKVTASLLPPKSQVKERREKQKKLGVKDEDEVLAVSDPALHQFVAFVPAVEEGDSYRIKIDYNQSESSGSSHCPLFTLRIAAKPLASISDENLSC